ncbi:MAG: hypothetical protein ACKOA8_09200, partial [Deltaproteobacteria bacterium]
MFSLQRLVFLILFTAHSFLAYAHVEEVSSIAVEREMAQWNANFSIRATERPTKLGLDLKKEGYTECAEVLEIKGAYICASQSQIQMNLALARASFFVEGLSGASARTVVRNEDPKVR